ncbi:hypothetical protein [Aquirhabdus parva]|uniref:Uncharacterized protein n=1 Tax=Aquirhabdus parva TaxID=2283318 RepID=A0A345P708_9GAMM|nr:hypothetical protein [Aquirhabdus parva]AXI03067.1 hypothetical protein HYN46_09580 [Aquirhabdus parva]
MQLKSTITVIGAKRSKGEMEGKPYDHTTIYTQDSLDQKNGDAIGSAGSDYRWGTSDNYKSIQGLIPPFNADVTLEVITTGKSTRMIIVDLKPVAQPSPKQS